MHLSDRLKRLGRSRRPTSNPASGILRSSRRSFLKLFGAAGATGLAGVLTKRRYDTGNVERTKQVDSMRDFLEGNDPDRRVTMFGQEYSYEGLVTLFSSIPNPPLGREETQGIMEGLGYMMMVEDGFGSKMDTNPDLEWLDRHVPFVSFANSFGLGQVNAYSARSAVLQNMDALMRLGALGGGNTPERIATLRPDVPPEQAENKVKEEDIKQALQLDMYQEGNLLSAFLVFHQGASLHSRWPKGKGKIKVDRQSPVGRRGLNLAVAAYSASVQAPLNAKAQTLMNEIDGDSSVQPLTVDGSLGKEGGRTRARMETVTQKYGLVPLDRRIVEARQTYQGREYGYEQTCELLGMKAWVEELETKWEKVVLSGNGIKSFLLRFQASPTPQDVSFLRNVIAGRHTLVFQTAYDAMKKHGNESKAAALLAAYVRNRSGDFLRVIGDSTTFVKNFPQGNYEQFMAAVTNAKDFIPKLVFDSKFSGLIPTAYLDPKWPWKDPPNVMERAVRAMGGSDGQIPEATSN